MLLELIATLCAGLFAGAAIYITLVEHPARLECGTVLAATEFGTSACTCGAFQVLSAPGAWIGLERHKAAEGPGDSAIA